MIAQAYSGRPAMGRTGHTCLAGVAPSLSPHVRASKDTRALPRHVTSAILEKVGIAAAATNGNGKARPATQEAPVLSLPQLQPLHDPNHQDHHHEQQPLVGLPGNTYEKINDCIQFLKSRSSLVPEIVIVLGSGLGAIADEMEDSTSIPYAEIPHFHAPGVVGHPGRLVLGRMQGVPALVLQGRFHYYEGHPMDEVILPIRLAKYLGCHSALITNAAGGLNASFRAGDLMLIEDHINMIGSNPLRGPNPSELGGPRFLDLSEPYDPAYCGILTRCAEELMLPPLQRGVYIGVSGPTYETRAEIRMFRAMGADAVGMSTVPEVIAARHLGVRVAAVSCITNMACGMEEGALSHDDVMVQGAAAADKMRKLLVAAVPRMAAAARAAGAVAHR